MAVGMPVTRRSRTFDVPIDEVWRVVSDPYRLPAWWPKTARVEGVDRHGWTSVLTTEKGRSVRADYRLTASERHRRRAWAQELEGTPFERLFSVAEYELELSKAPDGTKVTLQLRQGLKGWSRFGGTLVKRAARNQLSEALDGLGELLEVTAALE